MINFFTNIYQYIDHKRANKFPFIFLFFTYWINTYSELGSRIIYFLQKEDFLIESSAFLLLFTSSLLLFIQFKKYSKRYESGIKRIILITLAILILIWAFEEISWGQRIFDFSNKEIMSLNTQAEINIHNLIYIQPFLPKLYCIFFSFLSLLSLLKKNNNDNNLLPPKEIFYFLLLPAIYYFMGEILIHNNFSIRGYEINSNNIFIFQEVNEFLLAMGTFLYALKNNKKTKKLFYKLLN